MPAISISVPFPIFNDRDGQSLDNGYVYIGTPYLDPQINPVQVYFDEALTIPAYQPLRTINGYVSNSGTPAQLYVNGVNFSIKVLDKNANLVYSFADVTGINPNSSGVQYDPAGVGAVSTTVQAKLREFVSVKDFGAVGDGSNEYTKILAAWTHCIANGRDLYFPAGIYSSGINNMPFKNPAFPATSLLDCKNITIYGDGPNTILRSDSSLGADVLNLYSVKNLHIKNMKITANLSGTSGAGSNGLSIVGGFDNLTFDHIWFENLPYVQKLSPDYLDGGKAFSIQTGTPAEECGTIKATHIYATGCVYGAGLEVDLVNFATKKHAIDIDIVAEGCYQGIVVSAGAATGSLSSGMTMGLKVSGQFINCQRDVILSRAHGVQVDAQVITTKSIAARRLNPNGVTWATFDTIVDSFVCTYAKNSQVSIVGDKSNCDYIAQIGGATAGASGLGGYSEYCQIFLDVEGVAAIAPINLVNSGGNTINQSDIYITTQTAASLPIGFYTQALGNTLTVGPSKRLISPTIAGALNFAYTDGGTVYNSIERDDFALYAKQTGASSTNVEVFGVKSHTSAKLWFIRNDGYIATAGRATASNVSTIKGVLPIYDQSNVLWGYVPVYTTFTP
tara:strand:- start:107 stop:1963 length:1857 start_codon:yes stop_codon:yes gene_type:complete